MSGGPWKRTVEERFWDKVDRAGSIMPGMDTQCWVWTGWKYPAHNGIDFYGRMRDGNGMQHTHRLSYLWAYGELPEPPLTVDHICHNTLCVRPDHLRAASREEQQQNRKGADRTSLSGVRGVSWHKHKSRWVVQVTSNNQSHWGGSYDCLKDAEQAAIALRNRLMTHNDRDKINSGD